MVQEVLLARWFKRFYLPEWAQGKGGVVPRDLYASEIQELESRTGMGIARKYHSVE